MCWFTGRRDEVFIIEHVKTGALGLYVELGKKSQKKRNSKSCFIFPEGEIDRKGTLEQFPDFVFAKNSDVIGTIPSSCYPYQSWITQGNTGENKKTASKRWLVKVLSEDVETQRFDWKQSKETVLAGFQEDKENKEVKEDEEDEEVGYDPVAFALAIHHGTGHPFGKNHMTDFGKSRS
ncbi:hypothetical protein V2A60_009816 [Cordyceps javanica]